MGNKNIRQDLVDAALSLIREKGISAENITVRNIAQRAGGGVGLINYHFQSKDHLLELCVQSIITQVVARFEAIYKSLDLAPEEKLRCLAKKTCSYLAENENLSRISILTDFRCSAEGEDNTEQTIRAYMPVFREALGPDVLDQELHLRVYTAIHAFQAAFLRRESTKKLLGLDFFCNGRAECIGGSDFRYCFKIEKRALKRSLFALFPFFSPIPERIGLKRGCRR